MKKIVLFGLLCSLCCFVSGDRQVRADNKSFSGDIAVGVGRADPTNNVRDFHPNSVIGFLHLNFHPASFNGANIDVNIRHAFFEDTPLSYWPSKREMKAQLNVPIKFQKGLSFFALYQCNYDFKRNDFCVAGFRQGF